MFENIWIQPAAGDAGGAIGAAMSVWHQYYDKPRKAPVDADTMQGAYLGPSCSNIDITQCLDHFGAVYRQHEDNELFSLLSVILANENVIGWFQGRMEFGPRSLGCRSILADPRSQKMQSVMNLKIKYRESFRPFAPAVLAEDAGEYFEISVPSPYMLMVADVKDELRLQMTDEQNSLFGIEKLNVPRSPSLR